MKKSDLHIHTVATVSDRHFTFSLETFKRYVVAAKLDAVAVTNYDVFDCAQFMLIQQSLEPLGTTVFPGVEITTVEKGHLLVIARPSEVAEFDVKVAEVTKRIKKIGDSVTTEELGSILW